MARILVVDDDADILDVITHALRPVHQIVTASNGVDAIAGIKEGHRFDVILSDVQMPALDGVGLYLELLAIAPEQAQRIVLISSGGDVEPTLRVATDRPYLEKPFELARLRELVADVLERWGPTR